MDEQKKFDELPRWVDVAIAEYLLGLKVERRRPKTSADRLYPYEVTFFMEPDSGLVQWTYDDNACNFMAYRNGRDESDGIAKPLPLFVSGLSDSSEVLPLIEMLRERGIYVQITSTPEGYLASVWDETNRWAPGGGDEPQQAVGRALLYLLDEVLPS